VAQRPLDDSEFRALVRELGRKGVPQPVRVNALADTGLVREKVQLLPRLGGLDLVADLMPRDGAEDEPNRRQLAVVLANVEPVAEVVGAHRVHPHRAVARSCLRATDPEDVALEVHVMRTQPQRFGDADARPPEDDDQGAVADAGLPAVAGVEHRFNLGAAVGLRVEAFAGVRVRLALAVALGVQMLDLYLAMSGNLPSRGCV
jgi:hypothetical protein